MMNPFMNHDPTTSMGTVDSLHKREIKFPSAHNGIAAGCSMTSDEASI
jgi:hypothetical protein